MFLRIASCILYNSSENLSNELYEVYDEETHEGMEETEKVNKWIAFTALVTEVIASNRIDVFFNNFLSVNSPKIIKEE